MKLLIVLALVSVALAIDDRCKASRRGDCTNSCDSICSERCPRFFFYACPERERDECICKLYRTYDSRAVRSLDRCFDEIEMCKDKECPRDEECREEIHYCEEKDTRCRRMYDRRIEAKCQPRSCKDIKCSDGKNCSMELWRDGERRPRCITIKPRNCDEKRCSRDEKCEMREDRPICRRLTEEEKCRNVSCSEGYKCANRKCIRKTRKDFRCERDSECREIKMGRENISMCIRRITRERRCRDIDCYDGFRCEMRNVTEERERRLRPVCIVNEKRESRPPRWYHEIRCRDDEEVAICYSENKERINKERIARCRRRDDRIDRDNGREREDRREDREDRPTREPEERPRYFRRPPRDCNEIKCRKDERCHVFNYREMRIASCISEETPRACCDARCEDGEECHVLNTTSLRRHAVCFWRLSKEVNPNREAERCEELRCEGDFTCFRRREGKKWRARCRKIGSGVCQTRCDIFKYWRFRDDRRDDRCEERPIRSTVDPRPIAGRPDERDDKRPEERPEERPEDRRDSDNRRPEDRERREDERRDEERRNRPDQCLELECLRDEVCREEFLEDGRRRARCIPSNFRGRMEEFRRRRRTCEELECEEGFRCEERNERRDEREAREDREREEDADRELRRRREDRTRDEDRRRELREREEFRARDHLRREERRRNEDDERRSEREREDKECEDETKRNKERCDRRDYNREREDRETGERRRREDRRRKDERRRQDRDREEARRCEDRERRERRRKEDRDRAEKRWEGWCLRGARCIRERC